MAMGYNRSMVLLLVVAACAWRLAAAEQHAVCLVQNPGFANCNPANATATYTGFDVDLIRWVAAYNGWVEDPGPSTAPRNASTVHFYFRCTTMRVTPVIDILTANNTFDNCSMGAGSFTISTARWLLGTRFSYPYFRTGLGVLIATQATTTVFNPWAFLQPFHWTIWMALGLTLLCVPIIIWTVENLVRSGSVPYSRKSLHDWRHAVFTTMLTVFNLEVLKLRSLPSQIIIVCFCFLNLVIVSTYTANLAAALTTAVQQSGFQNINDLRGTNVAAHGIYVSRLGKNEFLHASTINWAGRDTFEDVQSLLLSGAITAYIFDLPLLLYWDNMLDPDCQLMFLGEYIEPFDYGIAFNKATPDAVVDAFNYGIVAAQQQAILTNLEVEYVSSTKNCNALTPQLDSLRFEQISGLWIILGSAIGLGILWSCFGIYRHHYRSARPSRRTAGLPGGPGNPLILKEPLPPADRSGGMHMDEEAEGGEYGHVYPEQYQGEYPGEYPGEEYAQEYGLPYQGPYGGEEGDDVVGPIRIRPNSGIEIVTSTHPYPHAVVLNAEPDAMPQLQRDPTFSRDLTLSRDPTLTRNPTFSHNHGRSLARDITFARAVSVEMSEPSNSGPLQRMGSRFNKRSHSATSVPVAPFAGASAQPIPEDQDVGSGPACGSKLSPAGPASADAERDSLHAYVMKAAMAAATAAAAAYTNGAGPEQLGRVGSGKALQGTPSRAISSSQGSTSSGPFAVPAPSPAPHGHGIEGDSGVGPKAPAVMVDVGPDSDEDEKPPMRSSGPTFSTRPQSISAPTPTAASGAHAAAAASAQPSVAAAAAAAAADAEEEPELDFKTPPYSSPSFPDSPFRLQPAVQQAGGERQDSAPGVMPSHADAARQFGPPPVLLAYAATMSRAQQQQQQQQQKQQTAAGLFGGSANGTAAAAAQVPLSRHHSPTPGALAAVLAARSSTPALSPSSSGPGAAQDPSPPPLARMPRSRRPSGVGGPPLDTDSQAKGVSPMGVEAGPDLLDGPYRGDSGTARMSQQPRPKEAMQPPSPRSVSVAGTPPTASGSETPPMLSARERASNSWRKLAKPVQAVNRLAAFTRDLASKVFVTTDAPAISIASNQEDMSTHGPGAGAGGGFSRASYVGDISVHRATAGGVRQSAAALTHAHSAMLASQQMMFERASLAHANTSLGVGSAVNMGHGGPQGMGYASMGHAYSMQAPSMRRGRANYQPLGDSLDFTLPVPPTLVNSGGAGQGLMAYPSGGLRGAPDSHTGFLMPQSSAELRTSGVSPSRYGSQALGGSGEGQRGAGLIVQGSHGIGSGSNAMSPAASRAWAAEAAGGGGFGDGGPLVGMVLAPDTRNTTGRSERRPSYLGGLDAGGKRRVSTNGGPGPVAEQQVGGAVALGAALHHSRSPSPSPHRHVPRSSGEHPRSAWLNN